jgi:hypothetical protein
MEGLERKKRGVYRKPLAPIGCSVHVVSVGRDGAIRKYSKIR